MKKIAAIIILFILAAGAALWYLDSAPALMQRQQVTVMRGQSLRSVARLLKRENLIRDERFFVSAALATRRTRIRSGTYALYPGMGSLEILSVLTSGKVVTSRVTIPEGFNCYQIGDRLEASRVCDRDDFLAAAGDRRFLASLGIEASWAEGYLYPDTYVFPQGSDARDVIRVMHGRMKKELAALGVTAGNVGEVLNLASLVEKEAKVAAERRLVSSVFHNRMKKRMRLDCDPTVRYAVKRFEGPITVSDLASDSPYNTYRRTGLPPTPICSPGRAAIEAALRPENSDYLYFVARNDGSHYFSKTLAEHNRAVDHYQRGKKTNFIDRQKRAE